MATPSQSGIPKPPQPPLGLLAREGFSSYANKVLKVQLQSLYLSYPQEKLPWCNCISWSPQTNSTCRIFCKQPLNPSEVVIPNCPLVFVPHLPLNELLHIEHCRGSRVLPRCALSCPGDPAMNWVFISLPVLLSPAWSRIWILWKHQGCTGGARTAKSWSSYLTSPFVQRFYLTI